jgi:hypothetical protein
VGGEAVEAGPPRTGNYRVVRAVFVKVDTKH